MKHFYTKKLVDKTLLLNETSDIILNRKQTITRTLFWGLIVLTEEVFVNQDLKEQPNKSLGFSNKK